MIKPIFKALCLAGSQATLARQCGVTQAAVSKWARGGNISATNARSIERATDGAVTVYDLRPDIFGPAPGVPPVIAGPAQAAERAA